MGTKGVVGLLRAWRYLGFGAGVSRYVIIWRNLGNAWVTRLSVIWACLWRALGRSMQKKALPMETMELGTSFWSVFEDAR